MASEPVQLCYIKLITIKFSKQPQDCFLNSISTVVVARFCLHLFLYSFHTGVCNLYIQNLYHSTFKLSNQIAQSLVNISISYKEVQVRSIKISFCMFPIAQTHGTSWLHPSVCLVWDLHNPQGGQCKSHTSQMPNILQVFLIRAVN